MFVLMESDYQTRLQYSYYLNEVKIRRHEYVYPFLPRGIDMLSHRDLRT